MSRSTTLEVTPLVRDKVTAAYRVAFEKDQKFTFVTIAFAGEMSNLLLQAETLINFGKGVVNRWIVVWNEPQSRRSVDEPKLSSLREMLERAAINISIVWRHIIIPFADPVGSGHRMQQVLKLLIAKFIEDPAYLLLDAKNHLIRPLNAGMLIFDDRPHAYQEDYIEGNFFHEPFERARDIFGIPRRAQPFFNALPSTTPYLMYTKVVCDMIGQLEKIEGRNWYDRILIKKDDGSNVTEFSLYNAFLERLGIVQEMYALSKYRLSLSIFSISPKSERQRLSLIREARINEEIKFFAVHRSRFERLSPREKSALRNLWSKRQVFRDYRAMRIFLGQS